MKRLLLLPALFLLSCGSDGFGKTRNPPRLVVEIDPMAKVGAADAPIDLAVDTPFPFKITVRAIDGTGAQDRSFTRYVRISSKPGAIEPLVGPDTDGRNVLLKEGESIQVEVRLKNAYGKTYILADDLGYVPADPLRDPPPQCSNDFDDDGDGAKDFPADNGCAFANDDAEAGGSFGEGASQPIFFKLPRIADVRGLKCEPTLGCSSNGATPYPKEQIQLNTGFNEDTNEFNFDTVVTRISSDGFYSTDINDPRKGGFNSIFAFNFNAPPRMRVCDRLKTFGGTANEFFGFTQISYPTWTLEEWDPSKRLCLVPVPDALSPGIIADTAELRSRSGNLVRVETPPVTGMGGGPKVKVTPKFGPEDVPKAPGGLYTPGPNASNCDFDKNGRINSFVVGDPEGDCSTACTADPECTEWSNFASRSTFRLTVTDSNGKSAAIQADASASAGFDPLAMKGQEIRSFTGTMHFFSGGSQFTIEARCKDDIIVPLTTPPFVTDVPCTDNAACATTKGFPPDYQCVPLGDGPVKGCRRIDPERPEVKEPPPLACVFPRTFLENNPQ